MRRIVVLCVMLFVLKPFAFGRQTIIMSSTPPADYHRSFGNFIEIKEGGQFAVSCRDDFLKPVIFDSTYLLNNAGFSQSRFEEMIVPGEATGNGLILRNMEAQIFDSGRYFCHRDKDMTLNMSIHVFVRGDSFFVPKKSAQIEVSEKWVVIPCTSTSMDTDVELLRDGESIQINYRPIEGFRILASSLNANTTVFECRHKKSGNTIAFTVHSAIPRTTTTSRSTSTTTTTHTTTTSTKTTTSISSSTTQPETLHGNFFWSMVFLASGVALIAVIVAFYIYKNPRSSNNCGVARMRANSQGNLIAEVETRN